jgi:hypothetical protein
VFRYFSKLLFRKIFFLFYKKYFFKISLYRITGTLEQLYCIPCATTVSAVPVTGTPLEHWNTFPVISGPGRGIGAGMSRADSGDKKFAENTGTLEQNR